MLGCSALRKGGNKRTTMPETGFDPGLQSNVELDIIVFRVYAAHQIPLAPECEFQVMRTYLYSAMKYICPKVEDAR